jgi:hypothetical protein
MMIPAMEYRHGTRPHGHVSNRNRQTHLNTASFVETEYRDCWLVVPPNPADIAFKRYCRIDTFWCVLGAAVVAPFNLFTRLAIAAAGIPFAYRQASGGNPICPTRFLSNLVEMSL